MVQYYKSLGDGTAITTGWGDIYPSPLTRGEAILLAIDLLREGSSSHEDLKSSGEIEEKIKGQLPSKKEILSQVNVLRFGSPGYVSFLNDIEEKREEKRKIDKESSELHNKYMRAKTQKSKDKWYEKYREKEGESSDFYKAIDNLESSLEVCFFKAVLEQTNDEFLQMRTFVALKKFDRNLAHSLVSKAIKKDIESNQEYQDVLKIVKGYGLDQKTINEQIELVADSFERTGYVPPLDYIPDEYVLEEDKYGGSVEKYYGEVVKDYIETREGLKVWVELFFQFIIDSLGLKVFDGVWAKHTVGKELGIGQNDSSVMQNLESAASGLFKIKAERSDFSSFTSPSTIQEKLTVLREIPGKIKLLKKNFKKYYKYYRKDLGSLIGVRDALRSSGVYYGHSYQDPTGNKIKELTKIITTLYHTDYIFDDEEFKKQEEKIKEILLPLKKELEESYDNQIKEEVEGKKASIEPVSKIESTYTFREYPGNVIRPKDSPLVANNFMFIAKKAIIDKKRKAQFQNKGRSGSTERSFGEIKESFDEFKKKAEGKSVPVVPVGFSADYIYLLDRVNKTVHTFDPGYFSLFYKFVSYDELRVLSLGGRYEMLCFYLKGEVIGLLASKNPGIKYEISFELADEIYKQNNEIY